MWNKQTVEGMTYYDHDAKPLMVAPHIDRAGVDHSRWQVVYLPLHDDPEPLTRAIYTLAGAQFLAEHLEGETLADYRKDLDRVVRLLGPDALAGWSESKRREQPGRWADGRYRTMGARAA